jgi:ubiquinone/menaquinone biosynthesis C-methylase UbiE
MIGDQKIITKGGHFKGFIEEIEKSSKVDGEFLSWFDTSENKKESFYSGEWDFSHHIFSQVVEYIDRPTNLKALEIGYGGGRMICAASGYFLSVVGLDIHNQSDRVLNLLKDKGVNNVELITLDNKTFPILDESIDLVYSFIVFQHLESIEVLEYYISECARILKRGGVGCIYFGRQAKFSEGRDKKIFYIIDKFMEFFLKNGYLEIESKVNEKNLVLSLAKIKKILKKYNFKIKKTNISTKKILNKGYKYGGQYGVIFKKI